MKLTNEEAKKLLEAMKSSQQLMIQSIRDVDKWIPYQKLEVALVFTVLMEYSSTLTNYLTK